MDEMYENLDHAVEQALQEGDLGNVLDILSNRLRQAGIYLSMDTGEIPRAGLRLAGWQAAEDQGQDFIISERRLRLWLGDQWDRTYSQSTLSSGDFDQQSAEEDGQSISLEEPSPLHNPQAIRDLLAHTPTPATTTPSPPRATSTRPPGGFYPTWVPPPPPWFHEPTPDELYQAAQYLKQSLITMILSTIILWFLYQVL